MKLKQILFTLLLLTALAAAFGDEAAGVRTVEITANDTMKFSVNKIECQPGEKMAVVLTNTGSLPKEAMGHNWVLLNAGVNAMTYANLAMAAKADNYQPKSLADKVLASIPILGPKESGKVSFSAPTTPGVYPFLCSFPAHCAAGMVGELIVK